jgi:hypothetical protein
MEYSFADSISREGIRLAGRRGRALAGNEREKSKKRSLDEIECGEVFD